MQAPRALAMANDVAKRRQMRERLATFKSLFAGGVPDGVALHLAQWTMLHRPNLSPGELVAKPVTVGARFGALAAAGQAQQQIIIPTSACLYAIAVQANNAAATPSASNINTDISFVVNDNAGRFIVGAQNRPVPIVGFDRFTEIASFIVLHQEVLTVTMINNSAALAYDCGIVIQGVGLHTGSGVVK